MRAKYWYVMVTNSDVMRGGGGRCREGRVPPSLLRECGSFDVSFNYKRKKTIRCTVLKNNCRLNLVFPLPREARKILRVIKLLRFFGEFSTLKGTMSLLQPTSNSVELCRNYEYVMYVLSVKFKR